LQWCPEALSLEAAAKWLKASPKVDKVVDETPGVHRAQDHGQTESIGPRRPPLRYPASIHIDHTSLESMMKRQARFVLDSLKHNPARGSFIDPE